MPGTLEAPYSMGELLRFALRVVTDITPQIAFIFGIFRAANPRSGGLEKGPLDEARPRAEGDDGGWELPAAAAHVSSRVDTAACV